VSDEKCRYNIQGLIDELDVSVEEILPLYSNYFSEMKEEVAELNECLAKEDWYMLERVVHNIKGVSANLNIQDVFEEASKFDILLKENNNSDAQGFVERINGLLEEAENEIKKYFAAYGFSL
jgi:HPt (histidine-containing phosphotransfer) domain-containing protein